MEVLAFPQYLLQAGMIVYNIANYITAIISKFIVYGFNTAPLKDYCTQLCVKAIRMNKP